MQNVRKFRSLGIAILSLGAIGAGGFLSAPAQTNLAVTVLHAPSLNSGTIQGSLQLLSGESTTLNSIALTGDLLLPGTPTIRLNGKPTFAGTNVGTGSVTPTGYTVTINSGSAFNYLRTRTTPTTLPAVSAPPAPTGTRSVNINTSSQSIGDPATLRDLTLNSSVGAVSLPAGTFGNITVNSSGSSLVIGVAGGVVPTVYNFQNLTLNSGSLKVAGPVIVNLANGLSPSGSLGATNNPLWLKLNIANGGLTLNGGAAFFGSVVAPSGAVTVNSSATLAGNVACSQFTMNGGCLKWSNTVVQPPVVTNQSIVVAENSSTNITLTGADPQGYALTYTVVTVPAHGTLSGTVPNLTYTPAANYYGADSFTFRASNGVTNSAAATVSLSVKQVIYPPVAIAQSVNGLENIPVAVTLAGTDPQGLALTYAVVTAPAHGTLSGTAPNLIYTPAVNYYGADAFTFKASNGVTNSAAATVSLTIKQVIYPPVAIAQSVSGLENIPVAVTLAGTDPQGLALTYAVVTAPAHGTLSGTAPNLIYTPAVNYYGADAFTFRASNGVTNSAAATVSLTIKQVIYAPVAIAQSLNNLENAALALTLTGTDPQGYVLTYTVATQPAHGKLSGTAPNLTYTPATNYQGSDAFTFLVNNGYSNSAPATISIYNQPVDYPPVVVAGANQTIILPQSSAILSGQVTYAPFPGTVNTVQWSKISGPGNVLFDNPTSLNTTASFSTNGIYHLQLVASDSFLSGSNDLYITVDAAPVVSAMGSTNTFPGVVTLQGSVSDDGLPTGSAVTVSWSLVSGAGTVVFGDASATNSSATFSTNGLYTLRLTADDGIATNYTDITVLENLAPVVTAGDSILTNGLQAVIQGSVSDDGLPAGVTTVWTQVSGPGTVAFDQATATGTTVTASQSGVYVLALTATDGAATSSSQVTVTFNLPPAVNAGLAQKVNFGTAATLAAVVTDDQLPFNSLNSVWTQVSGPGTATFADATATNTTVTFDQPGVYILRLTSNDGFATNSAEVLIGVNAAPVVAAGAGQTVVLGVPVTLAGAFTDDGVSGLPVTVQWAQVGGPAIAVIDNSATTNATVNFAQSGVYVFQLTVNDGMVSASAQTTIIVDQAPTVSVFTPSTVVTWPDNKLWLNGLVLDDGYPADGTLTSTWSLVSGPGTADFSVMTASNALAGVVISNAMTTTVTLSSPGVYVLALTATDGLTTNSQNLTVTVNSTPVVNAGSNQTIIWPVDELMLQGTVADDGLPTDGALTSTWSVVSGPGTVEFDDAGLADANATFSASGTYVLALTASDGISSSSSTVTITVDEAPAVVISTPSIIITWPSNQVTLEGVVTDDGLPTGAALTSAWSVASGPTNVLFSTTSQNAILALGSQVNQLTTTATFGQPGSYVVSLTADDSLATNTASVTVILNQAPVVNSAPVQAVFGAPVALAATATDDKLPYNQLTTSWSQVSGPGIATFADATATNTTVTFDQAGVYTLAVTVSDGVVASSAVSTATVTTALQPYAADTNTLVLFHFNETNSTVTTNLGTLGGNAYCVTNGTAVASPATVTTILGAAGYTNFGTAAAFVGGKLIGYDYNKSGAFNGDVSASSLSADAFPMSKLNIGNGGQTPWTLEAVIYPTATNVNQEIITTDSTATSRGFQFRLNTAGQLELNLIAAGADLVTAIPTLAKDPINGYVPNTWFHVAATYDGANVILYWTKLSPAVTAAHPISTNAVVVGTTFGAASGPLGIGNRTRGAASEPFLGRVDEVRISSVARSAAQMFFTNYLPTITPTVASVTNPVYVGMSVVLSATVSGPQPVTVKWQTDGGTSGSIWTNLLNSNTNAYTLNTSGMAAGSYQYRLVATNPNGSATNAPATLVLRVEQGPTVVIAAPAVVNWPGNQLSLAATITDDGLPSGRTLSSTWSVVSGPGSVTFSTASQTFTLAGSSVTNTVSTTATFGLYGTYVLSLTANDSLITNTATTTVMVNQAPVANAGASQTVSFGSTVTLAGTATDDQLPNNVLTTTWSQVRGPGTATFANAASTNTTVTFDQGGIYTLRLTANDGSATGTSDCQIFAPTPLQPYAVDTNTLVLFHFNETNTTVTTNLGSLGGNAYCVTNGTAVASPATITTILGAVAYSSNFGTAAAFVGGKLIGYDYNKSGAFNGDVSASSLSADAFTMNKLNMGNGGQTPWTLEAMICPTATNVNQEIITTDSYAGSRGFQFRLNTAGQIELNLIAAGADLVVPIPTLAKDAVNGYVANTWYHVAAAYNGTNVVFYWTKLSPTITAANPISTNAATVGTTFGAVTGPLGIGNKTRAAAGEPFLGKIDEVRISNVARSASQMFFAPYLPSATPTVISPANLVYAGTTVTVSATVSGPQPMAYAWQCDGGTSGVTWTNLLNSTTNTCSVDTTALAAGSYQYRLVASNSNGLITNTPATLSVLSSSGLMVNAGAAQTVDLGTVVSLLGSVVSSQSQALTADQLTPYALTTRWSQVSGPGAATFADATVTNTTVTFDQAGYYTLRLTAYDGYVTNSADCLVMVLAPNHAYTADASTLVLFHFSEANGTATTNLGSLGGVAYSVTNGAGVSIPATVSGVLGAAAYTANFDTATIFAGGNLVGYDYNRNGYYDADVSASSLSADALPMSLLNMGNGGQTPWTLEAMICPTATNVNQEIITTDSYAGNRGFQFRLNTAGQLELNLIYAGVDIVAPIPTPATDSVNGYVSNTWYHVAATYDGAKVVLYWTKVSPAITAANPISTTTATVGTTFGAVTGPLGIGNKTRAAAGEPFLGKIDEVRISSVARSATEMCFITYVPAASPTVLSPASPVYAGTVVTLSSAVSGPQPMTYKWQCDGGTSGVTWTNLLNSTTNTYTLNTSSSAAGTNQYRLVASNPNGAVTNNPATLVLMAASGPILVTDASASPSLVFAGGSTTLAATFTGTLPLSCQWYFTNSGTVTAVTGATNQTLVLTSLQTNSSGAYFLQVSNNAPGVGSMKVLTSLAYLTVMPLASAESGMYCELLQHPEQTYITASNPKLGWVYTPSFRNDMQTAYRIIVASTMALANAGTGDMWDSGQVSGSNSINLAYAGSTLQPNSSYFWRVQTQNSANTWSAFSAIQQFNTGGTLVNNLTAGLVYKQPSAGSANCYPLRFVPVTPVLITTNSSGHWFIDFGKDAFAYATVQLNGNFSGSTVTAAFGELASGTAVNSAPPSGSCIRYGTSTVALQNGSVTYSLRPPSNSGNPTAWGINTPSTYGTVMPFRYLELTGIPAGVILTTNDVVQLRLQSEFNDNAATFASSSTALNQVWGLCQYSMKALTFNGIYVDGDRERTPYEADMYLQMLSSYGVNNEFTMARCSFEYLTNHLTWPTEWPMHMIFAAWADYQQTGDPYLMTKYYGFLTNKCMLSANATASGLVWSYPATGNTHATNPSDIIDWYRVGGDGVGNVDGYVAGATNSVINAFYYRCLTIMSNAAALTGHSSDAVAFGNKASLVYSNYNSTFWNTSSQSYKDNTTTTHSSMDANFFPLAFGLVPAANQTATVNYIHSRIAAWGAMPAGVYGAQYLLEGMFQAGDSDVALGLMSTNNTRSWMNMINLGSTITCEAWSVADKSNEDLNHAWSAAPANLIPRYVLGVRPLTAGYGQILIQPQIGQTLTYASGMVPTIRGPVSVAVTNGTTYDLAVTIPGNVVATVLLPTTNTWAYVDGASVSGTVSGTWLTLTNIGSGQHSISLTAPILVASAAQRSLTVVPVPTAPTGLTATAGDGEVTLSWNAVANATGYRVKSALSSNGTYAATAEVASLVTTNSGLTNGVLYYYVVAATNAVGTGADSTPISARPTSMVAPQLGLVAGQPLKLAWPAPNTGWLLQVQTNGLGSGLGTNWSTLENSEATNQITIQPDPTKPGMFFRLKHP